MPNINSATNFFPRAAENSVSMTLGAQAVGGTDTTVTVNGMSNYSDGDVVVFTVDPSGTSKQVFTGTKSGSTVINVVWTEGTNSTHLTGATVIDEVTATHWDLFQKGILTHANQNGTLKAIAKKSTIVASSATPTPNTDTTDLYILTALAVSATFGAPTGTPVEGQTFFIRIKDNGTAQSLSWNAIYRAVGNALPTTTVISKTLYLGFLYNSEDLTWDLVGYAQQP